MYIFHFAEIAKWNLRGGGGRITSVPHLAMSQTLGFGSLGKVDQPGWETILSDRTHPSLRYLERPPSGVEETERTTVMDISKRMLFSRGWLWRKAPKDGGPRTERAVALLGTGHWLSAPNQQILDKETPDNTLPVFSDASVQGVKACVWAYGSKEHKDVWGGC